MKTDEYSNRFAAHFLKTKVLTVLLKTRDWMSLSNDKKSKKLKTKKKLPGNITAELNVYNADLGTDEPGFYDTYPHVSSDQVCFYKGKELMKIQDVPVLIFSEVMRDVDMFVGVTSIGNDPEWENRGNDSSQEYWERYSSGDLSERSLIRKETLEKIIPYAVNNTE